VNDGGGNGARCGGVKVRTDTTKLSDMVVYQALEMVEIRSEKIRCSSKMKPRLRAEWVVLSEELCLCILSSCFLSPMSKNSVWEDWRN